MEEPTERIAAVTSANAQHKQYQQLSSSVGAHQGTTIVYQLEMNNVMENMMNLMNKVKKQDEQNAEESGKEHTTINSF